MISITDVPEVTQLNADMAISIFNDIISERDRDHAYYQRIISDQGEQISERDERIADLEQRLEVAECTNKQLSADLESERTEKSKLLSSNIRMADRLHLNDLIDLHTKNIWQNDRIDSGTKITATQFVRDIIHAQDGQNLHEPVELTLEDIAKKTGQSASSVSRHSKKLAKVGALDASSYKEEFEKGKFRTQSVIALQDILDHPEQVAFEKQQGGARLRTKDGEALDTISADYSRSQDTVYIRMLPGQRADLDPSKFINAIQGGRCILDKYAHERVQKLSAPADNHIDQALPILDPAEKQDAFADRDSQIPTTDAESVDQTPVGESDPVEEQDAFVMPAQPRKTCQRCETSAWLWNESKQKWTCRACFVAANPQAPTFFYDHARMQEALDNLESAAGQQIDPSPWVLDIMTDQGWDHYITIGNAAAAQ